MAYKRNPMRSERICSLARFVMGLPATTAATHATQWMERTLDDSANRRLVLPQAFLAVDAVLILCQNVTDGLVVYPKVISRNLQAELPFMASENILMAAVAAGGDRQELHERIRQHSQDAARVVKQEGGENDLLDRLAADEAFAGVDLDAALDASQYVGRAPEQVDEFVADVVEPIRGNYGDVSASDAEVHVSVENSPRSHGGRGVEVGTGGQAVRGTRDQRGTSGWAEETGPHECGHYEP
jgi:adenylosuccinate lyase